MKHAIARTFRGASAPLLWYYAIAVVVPLLNGAAFRDVPFVEHACFVLLVPPAILLMVAVMGAIRAAPRSPAGTRRPSARAAR